MSLLQQTFYLNEFVRVISTAFGYIITSGQGQNPPSVYLSYLEFICKFFFLFFELVHRLLIPASGLGLQITGSSRDDSRLLEQSTIQGHRLNAERGGVS